MSQIEYHDQAERLLWSHGIRERVLREQHQQDEVDAWLGRAERIWFKEPEILVIDIAEPLQQSFEASEPGQLEEAINRSRSLIQSDENQCNAEDTLISLATWQRVRRFLLKQASASMHLFRLPIPPPNISPADEGSIDVYWQMEGRELLLNFPANESEPVTYYGQTTAGDQTTAGRTTSNEERPDLIAWLIQSKK